MKRTILITLTIISNFFSYGQPVPQELHNSWKVKWNNKLVLNSKQENESSNSRKISLSEWKKNGSLQLIYTEVENPNFWRRSFLFYDENNNQLLAKDSVNSVRISLSSLRKLFAGKKEIRIYTIVAPLDPNIAVRMRRVHLCTLRLP